MIEDRQGIKTDYRLQAGKLLRKVEARKVVQQSVRSVDADQAREAGREAAIDRRRLKLMDAGLWPCPDGWDADLLSDDYEPASVAPCTVADLITALQAARAKRRTQPAGDQRRDD